MPECRCLWVLPFATFASRTRIIHTRHCDPSGLSSKPHTRRQRFPPAVTKYDKTFYGSEFLCALSEDWVDTAVNKPINVNIWGVVGRGAAQRRRRRRRPGARAAPDDDAAAVGVETSRGGGENGSSLAAAVSGEVEPLAAVRDHAFLEFVAPGKVEVRHEELREVEAVGVVQVLMEAICSSISSETELKVSGEWEAQRVTVGIVRYMPLVLISPLGSAKVSRRTFRTATQLACFCFASPS